MLKIAFIALTLFTTNSYAMGSKRMKVAAPDYQRAKRVVFIGIDGLGGHNLEHKTLEGKTPNISALRNKSAWTHKAFIDLHALSGPNWSGMLTANRSSRTKINSNKCTRGKGLTTIFDQIKKYAPKMSTALVTNWNILKCYPKEGSIDTYSFLKSDEEVTDRALEILKKTPPNFFFIYLGDVDNYGHGSGKGNTPEYNKAVINADKQVGRIMNTLEEENLLEDTLVILASDHGHGIVAGGHSWGLAPVPFYVSHPAVKIGKMRWRMVPSKQIRIHLVAPLSAYFLGLPDAPEWQYSAKAMFPYIVK